MPASLIDPAIMVHSLDELAKLFDEKGVETRQSASTNNNDSDALAASIWFEVAFVLRKTVLVTATQTQREVSHKTDLRTQVVEKVTRVTSELLGIGEDQISSTKTFIEMGCDGLDMVELQMALEESYPDLPFDFPELEQATTINEMVDAILTRI